MCELKRLSLSAAAATAAQIYRKRLLKSLPICDPSHRSLSVTFRLSKSRKTYNITPLPAELSGSVSLLTCESAAHGGVCDVYVIGTRRRIPESCEEVKAVIQILNQRLFSWRCALVELMFLRPAQSDGSSGEFRVAYEEAMKYGAKVILGDRPIGVYGGKIIRSHMQS